MTRNASISCTPQRDVFISPLSPIEALSHSASSSAETSPSSITGSNHVFSVPLGTVAEPILSLPDPWPVLVDKITVICHVVDAEGQSVNAAIVLATHFNAISQDISTADGRVLREHGTECLKNPVNRAVTKVWANENRLMLTVNPTRWIQGDAAFCPLDPHDIIQRTIAEHIAILSVPGLAIKPSHLSLLHVTAMFDAECPRIARRLLEALKCAATKGRAEITTYRNSIYFGQHSSLKSLKIYVDRTKDAYGYREPDYMGRMLRGEAVFHDLGRQYGQGSLSWFDDFYRTNLSQLLWDEVTEIRCYTSQIALTAIPELLTNAELGIYTRWQNHCLPVNHRDYRRLRNSILRKIGVDVFCPYRDAVGDDVQGLLSFDTLVLTRNVTANDHRREMMAGRVVDERHAEMTRAERTTEPQREQSAKYQTASA